jgi:hypothetical protein
MFDKTAVAWWGLIFNLTTTKNSTLREDGAYDG